MANSTYILRSYETFALIEQIDKSPTSTCLLARPDKANSKCIFTVCNRSSVQDTEIEFHEETRFEAIYGIYHFLRGAYIALLVESEVWVSLPKMNIRRAKSIIVRPLFQAEVILTDSQQSDENEYLELLRRGFKDHSLFYSNDFDVTQSQQRLAKLRISKSFNTTNPWKTADSRFFWNLEVVSDLIACSASKWITPFMSAHIEIRPDCTIDEHNFTLLFISRRSRYNQGCRFFKRGVDANGDVANFVETEQTLLFSDGRVMSFVQIRGSIPILWRSLPHLKYEPEVKIGDSQKSVECATAHVKSMLECYSDAQGRAGIFFVNLIDQKKAQGRLGEAFKNCIEDVKATTTSRMHAVDFTWFDFHAETKKAGKWKNLSKIIPICEKIFQAQGHFAAQADGSVTNWQVGCIRTNCLDNLDRTNVVQSLFGRRSVLKMLGKLNAGDSSDALNSPYPAFEQIYKGVWANNANSISFAYAGTGALKVDFTKTGKRTLAGGLADAINSCKRYYINNFTDGIKQDSIDLMLGNFQPKQSSRSPFGVPSHHDDITTTSLKFFFYMLILFTVRMMFWSAGANSREHLHICAKQVFHGACYIFFTLMFLVVRKGSSLGKRLVVNNRLCQLDPL